MLLLPILELGPGLATGIAELLPMASVADSPYDPYEFQSSLRPAFFAETSSRINLALETGSWNVHHVLGRQVMHLDRLFGTSQLSRRTPGKLISEAGIWKLIS